MYEEKSSLKRRIFFIILPFLVIIPFVFIYYYIGCPFLEITHIPCPGCGMTRGVLASLRLDFSTAFYYHPLWFLVYVWLIMIIYYTAKNIRSKKLKGLDLLSPDLLLQKVSSAKPVIFMACLSSVLLIAVYAYRMLTGNIFL